MQKAEISMIQIQELGVYTFEEKKCQTNMSCWLLVNLGDLKSVAAAMPSGQRVFSLTENTPFALLLPSGGCFDFEYGAGREDWVIELQKGAICESSAGSARLSWEGMEADVPAFMTLDAGQAERSRVFLTRMLEAFHSPEKPARTTLHLAFHALLDCILHAELSLEMEDPAEALRRRIVADRGFVRPLSTLSMACGYSPDHLRRLFESRFGISPKAFRTNYRMHLAQDLLKLRDLTVQEVAVELGYGHPGHFSSAFKKYFGQSPKAWKEQQPQPVSQLDG
jgi:AraC-like DNA-binding protein